MWTEYLPVRSSKTDGLSADKIVWILDGQCGRFTEKNEHRISNVQHRMLNGKDVETDLWHSRKAAPVFGENHKELYFRGNRKII